MMTLPEPTAPSVGRQTSAGPGTCLRRACTIRRAPLYTRPWDARGRPTGADHAAGWREVAAGDWRRCRRSRGGSTRCTAHRSSSYAGRDRTEAVPGPGLPDADILLTQDPAVRACDSNCRLAAELIADSQYRVPVARRAPGGWNSRRASRRRPSTRSRAEFRPAVRRSDCGPVGPSISAAVTKSTSPCSRSSNKRILRRAHRPLVLRRRSAGHWYFDRSQSAQDQLAVAGVPRHRFTWRRLVHGDPPRPSLLLPRDGKASGRMAAVIRALA